MAVTSDIKVYNPKDFPGYLPKLGRLYDDLFSGGKGFRGKLIAMMAEGVGLMPEGEKLLAQTIEFIHNASLLHDDLVDRSQLRRGKTTAWLKYTPEYAVLAGDYLLARVMVNLSSYGNIRLVHYTAEVISDLLEGEWLQDSLVGDFQIQLKQLDQVHNLKTASLFKWCFRSPFYAIGKSDEALHQTLEEMGTLLGQLFQRSDDLLDFDIRNTEGKAILGDLKSGYLNSFAAYCCQEMPIEERAKLKNIQSLENFYQALGGEDKFKAKLSAFDAMNEGLIGVYQHHLNSVSKSLGPELTKNLSKLPDLLYWRKKPS